MAQIITRRARPGADTAAVSEGIDRLEAKLEKLLDGLSQAANLAAMRKAASDAKTAIKIPQG